MPKEFDPGGANVVVAATGAGVLAAAHRAVGDVDHVLDRPQTTPFGTGVGTATDGHHARQDLRLEVMHFWTVPGLSFTARCFARSFLAFSG